MPDGIITIGGEDIDIGGLCVSFDSARFAGMPGAIQLQDAFRKIASTLSITLGDYVEGGLEAAGNSIGVDGIWLGLGPGLPAGAAGGVDAEGVVGHIANYGGAGVHVPGAALPPATAPAVAVIDDVLLDPVNHVMSAVWVYAARPFTCTTPIVYTGGAPDVISHAAVGASTLDSVSGKYLKGIRPTDDGTGHVADSQAGDYGTLPVVPEYGYLKWAQVTEDYAPGAGAITCKAKIENAGVAETVALDYNGTWDGADEASSGSEFPNARVDDRIPVYQDSAGAWRTPTGVHDQPLGNVIMKSAVPASEPPPGWSRIGSGDSIADHFPKLGATPGTTGGASHHKHTMNMHTHSLVNADGALSGTGTNITTAQVTGQPSQTYTEDLTTEPLSVVFGFYKRIP